MSISTAEPGAEALLRESRQLTDAILEEWAARLVREVPGRRGEAMGYALRSPGKRVRPGLVIASYRACGGTSASIAGVAAAVETVHTYSLVHDDLPCMDDDDLRRGRPTTHREFDPPTATLVGFLLVPVAARVLAEAARGLGLAASELGALAAELFSAGGVTGMVGGQWLDLEAEGRALGLEELRGVHRAKTGALIEASCVLGALAARASAGRLEAIRGYGREVGLAFQVADDVLDATGTSEELGKTAGKDAAVAKSTYVQLMGVDGAREAASRHASAAVEALERAGVPSDTLAALARYIVTRRH
ncbi:MAG TPA: farnesyl diphosphate synthase [Gemmatimonadales bacterium]|nr:farnesyl diphosphate synthase [Gemmatimonadales bacterium]